jgi:hypothetical protein
MQSNAFVHSQIRLGRKRKKKVNGVARTLLALRPMNGRPSLPWRLGPPSAVACWGPDKPQSLAFANTLFPAARRRLGQRA